VDVKVTTPSGTSATGSADHFTDNAAPAPTITGINATSGSTAGGTIITIQGTDLGDVTAVKFGTVSATNFTVLSNGWIEVTVPPGVAGTVDVTVTTSSGTSATSSADRYTYVAAAAPVVSQVAPTGGTTAGGTVVTIVGSGILGATAVAFGSLAGWNFVVLSDSVIVATAPAESAGTVDVTVTTDSGTSATTSADHYTYS
jgi:spore coat protein U-like protein